MSRWFRMYDELLDDPKVQTLAPEDFRGWVNLLCLASRNGGKLPAISDIAFALRETPDAVSTLVERLRSGGLIARRSGGADGAYDAPYKWDERQYKSDTSTQRVKRFRERFKPVTETPPDTEAETEEEANASSIVCAEKVGAVSRVLRSTFRADGFHALPPGWIPSRPLSPNTQTMVENWPPGALSAELESFKAWAANAEPKKGKGLKKDWDDAFGNWIRREHRDRYSKVVSLRGDRPSNPLTLLYRSTMQPEDSPDGDGARLSLPSANLG
jgi:hypothetical protein